MLQKPISEEDDGGNTHGTGSAPITHMLLARTWPAEPHVGQFVVNPTTMGDADEEESEVEDGGEEIEDSGSFGWDVNEESNEVEDR